MIWPTAYLLAGVIVFFGLRAAFKKMKIDPKEHDNIWASWIASPEGWIFAIPLWPLFAVSSLCWFLAELLHASGRKEIRQYAEIKAKQATTYDHLTLDQKIKLLEAQKRK